MTFKAGKLARNAALGAVIACASPLYTSHSLGYAPALASDRHDSAAPYNNNTDNVDHESNQDNLAGR